MNSVLCSLMLTGAAVASLAPSAQAHVGLDAPNGGEVLTAGQTYPVEWHLQVYHGASNWDLEYSTTGPAGPWIPIATDLPQGSVNMGDPHFFDWTVPDTPSSQVRVRVHQDNATGMDYVDMSFGDLTIQCAAPAPSNYCTSSPNSAGPGATIGSSGSTSIGSNDFGLLASGAPPHKMGIFFYGPQQAQLPLGDGTLCIGPGTSGLFRLNPPQPTDAFGLVQRALDLTQPPADAGPGQLLPGSTWNFQFWYRDSTSAGFNLSDALSVTFCG